ERQEGGDDPGAKGAAAIIASWRFRVGNTDGTALASQPSHFCAVVDGPLNCRQQRRRRSIISWNLDDFAFRDCLRRTPSTTLSRRLAAKPDLDAAVKRYGRTHRWTKAP